MNWKERERETETEKRKERESQKWNGQERQRNGYVLGGPHAAHEGEVPHTSQNLAWRRLEEVSFTILVDNLPLSVTRSWLWQLFGYEGKMVDVFLSRKRRKNNHQPLAFVRFAKQHEAKKAIMNLHESVIRGCKIKVSMAEFKRKEDIKRDQAAFRPSFKRLAESKNGAINQGMSYKDVLNKTQTAPGDGKKAIVKTKDKEKVDDEEKYDRTRVVYGKVDKIMVRELARSIVGENLMEAKLRKTFLLFESIRALGAYNALITFATKEDMAKTMNEGGSVLREYFDNLCIWIDEKVCQTRRVWVECFGMPIHAWSSANPRKIAEI